MTRCKGFERYLGLSTIVLAVCLVTFVAASPAQAGVKVRVIQVKASNKGEEGVDPALGDLGERLKKRFPYKNFKKVGDDTHQGGVGDKLEYGLANESTLTLTILEIVEKVVSMQAVVDKLSTKVRVRSGTTFIINVPWGEDLLILALTPSD